MSQPAVTKKQTLFNFFQIYSTRSIVRESCLLTDPSWPAASVTLNHILSKRCAVMWYNSLSWANYPLIIAEACFDGSFCLSVFQAANQWYVNWTHALEALCCAGLVLCCLIVNLLNLVCVWCCDTEPCENYCLSFLIPPVRKNRFQVLFQDYYKPFVKQQC